MYPDRELDTVVTGTEVHGSDGGKVGIVGQVGSDHLLVERGLLATKRIRVPYSAVARVDSNGVVHLSISGSQAKTTGVDTPMIEAG